MKQSPRHRTSTFVTPPIINHNDYATFAQRGNSVDEQKGFSTAMPSTRSKNLPDLTAPRTSEKQRLKAKKKFSNHNTSLSFQKVTTARDSRGQHNSTIDHTTTAWQSKTVGEDSSYTDGLQSQKELNSQRQEQPSRLTASVLSHITPNPF